MQPGDLTTLANAKAWLGLSGLAIAGITNANPAVVTLVAVPPTPLSTGLSVGFAAINGMTELNGTEQVITTLTPLTFSIPVDTTAFAAYTSGGLASVSDSLVARLISAVSAYIQAWADRTFRNLAYTEYRDGQGGDTLPLKNYPITSVSAVTVNGVTVPPAPPLAAPNTITEAGFFGAPAGYVYDATRLMLRDGRFWRGRQNVEIIYAGGFLVSNEAQTVPASPPYALATLAYWNAGDRGVTYAAGGALGVVPFGAPIATGQYSVDSNGVYYFSVGDAGAAVLISYGYIPADIEQAAIDCIGDWFRYRARIGVTSMAIEQQTITYVNTPMPARAANALQQHKRVAWATP
jgi:Ubiquitin-activating enzyme E1 FCCH domain